MSAAEVGDSPRVVAGPAKDSSLTSEVFCGARLPRWAQGPRCPDFNEPYTQALCRWPQAMRDWFR
jgi:hypothetical protein